MLCYSLLYDSSGRHVERLRRLSQIPVELVIALNDLRELGVFEVAEPLLEGEATVTAVKLVEPLSELGEDDLEKVVALADELNSYHVVIRVEKRGLAKSTAMLERLFRLAATYAKKVALEPSKDALPDLASHVSDFLGGVFKYALSPEPEFNTNDLLELALSHLGQLAAVKLVCFTRDGRATRVTGSSSLNVFAIIRELLGRGYDGFFVIDYEPRGLFLPASFVREDIELLSQYVRSIFEKTS